MSHLPHWCLASEGDLVKRVKDKYVEPRSSELVIKLLTKYDK